jgi:hypothetical protein
MTRFWPDGIAIVVGVSGTGDPHHFEWEGQEHQVQMVAKRWRVDEEWWMQRLWREYFKVTTDTGFLVIIYQDLLTNRWFLQRLYD